MQTIAQAHIDYLMSIAFGYGRKYFFATTLE